MNIRHILACLISTFFSLTIISGKDITTTDLTESDSIRWTIDSLPSTSPMHPNIGLAGVYAGMIGDKMIVAGGANFPDGTPEQGGTKKWHSDIYVLNTMTGEWKIYPDALPVPAAYGSCFPDRQGLLLAGGCNSTGCLDTVWSLTLGKDDIPVIVKHSTLPLPLANMAGASFGGKIYLAGGISSTTGANPNKTFLCLDTTAGGKVWKELKPWDGKPRAFAVATFQSNGLDNCFYLFSGRDFAPGQKWDVLDDGWEYNPRLDKWRKIDGSFPVMAGSATSFGTNHILLAGGRRFDGTDEKDNVLRLYHTVTNTMLELPAEDMVIPVTTAMVRTGNSFYIVSGETSAGVRTPAILKGTLESNVHPMGWLDTAVIIAYFLVLTLMGIYFSRKQKNADDYFKGGGRIPWFIAGLSIFGTALSAITFMSLPAKAYATDWSYVMFNFGIILVVPLITLIFIPFYRKLNVTTAYEYLEKRFNPFVRILSSLSFIIYQVGRMGIVLLLPSIALNVVTGFGIGICIALMGIFALIYTYLGGIEAVAWTDALQVVVLLGAAVTVVCVICHSLPGGMTDVINEGAANSKFDLGSLNFDLRQATLWTVLIATAFTNITTYGTDQTIVQRYLTTGSEKGAKRGVYTNAILTIPATLLFFFVGTCLYVFFKTHPYELSPGINDADAILPYYVSLHLPTGVLGLIIAGIFAAAMSTLSASMNSAATAYVNDIHSRLNSKSDRLKTAKNATVIIGIIGIAFAFMMHNWNITSLWDEFSKILGLLLGGLGGLFLLGMLCKKANSAGAITGLAASLIVQLVVMEHQSVYLLLYSTVGFLTCFIVGYVVSVCTGGPRKNIDGLSIGNIKNK